MVASTSIDGGASMEAGRVFPPVDLDGFRSAMREVGVEEIVEPTLKVFVEEAATIFAALREGVASGVSESVRTAAHSLKSSSGNVRATGLAELLEHVEVAAGQGNMVEVRQLFPGVRAEYETVIAFLAKAGVI